MVRNKVDNAISRYDKLKSAKQNLVPVYRLISQYIFNREFDGCDIPNSGVFVDNDIFDNTAQRANSIMANVMVNNLWPNGPRTFSICPTWDTTQTDEIKNYFQWANNQIYSVMDATRAGLQTGLEEYMTDQGSYGVSGIYVEENEKDDTVPVRYIPWAIKNMCIDEGPDRTIDTIFYEMEMTIRKAAAIYGIDSLSASSRKAYDGGDLERKIKILFLLEPRRERDPRKFGAKDMPIASLHIELGSRKILKESGFDEMPVFVGRFMKVPGEVYGRSPAMVAMADILEMNALREAIGIATEKQLDPPLVVLDDGTLGGGTIDTSAGAVNVFSMTGHINGSKPIDALYTVGELQSSYKYLDTLTEKINNHFYLDRLLDFNNETRMTLGEAQLRDTLRGQSLGTFYARQESEVLTPIINRTITIMLKRGRLGVLKGSKEEMRLVSKGIKPMYIPDEIATRVMTNAEVYDLVFLSPAKRTMQSEELHGIMDTANFVVGMAPVNPEIVDNVDFDKMLNRVAKLSGAPLELLKSGDTVSKIRKARGNQQAQAAQLEQARQQSEIGRNVAQANSMGGEAAA